MSDVPLWALLCLIVLAVPGILLVGYCLGYVLGFVVNRLRRGVYSVGHYGLVTDRAAAMMRAGHPATQAVWADYRKVRLGSVWLVLGRRWEGR